MRLASILFTLLLVLTCFSSTYTSEPAQDNTADAFQTNVRSPDSHSLEYIVIGPENFSSPAEPLVQWKTRKGVPAVFRSTQSIYSEYASAGKDELHKIRQYLKSEHSAHPELKWVLILGDSDVIPIRSLFAGAEPYGLNTYPSDHYLSALDGTWDSDNNGVYGEDPEDEDWIPELFVGRLPVSTASEVDIVVSKIISYERTPPDGEWYTRALIMGSLMDAPNVVDLPETQTEDEGYNDYKDNAFKVKKRSLDFFPSYYSLNELYDYDRMTPGSYSLQNDTLTRDNAVAEFNKGYAIINFAGQARFNGNSLMQYDWEDGTGTFQWDRFVAWNDLYRYEDARAATNGGMLPFIMMPTCDAANFTEDDDTNMERLMTAASGGAIGIISSTGESHRGESFDGGSYGNWWEDEQFWRIFFQEQLYRPGEALARLKVTFAGEILASGDQHPTTFKKALKGNLEGLTLLGDPEVPIWTDVPGELSASVSGLTTGTVTLDVLVTDRDSKEPVEDALVALQNDRVYAYGRTDVTGRVWFNATFTSAGPLNLTVTAHNYMPLEKELDVPYAAPRIQSIDDVTIDEDTRLNDFVNLKDMISDADNTFEELEILLETSDDRSGVVMDPDSNIDILPEKDWFGSAKVTISASDSRATSVMDFTLSVLPINDAPVLRGVPDELLAWEDRLFVYSNLSAYDPDSTDLIFSDDTELFKINESTGRFSFIPASSHAGRHEVCITVTDGIDSATGCFELTVFSIQEPPVIADIDTITVREGEKLQYRVIAYDEDGDNLTYSASPSWLGIDPATGEISITPGSDRIGSHDVEVTVTDGTHTTSEKFTLQVESATDYRAIAMVLAFVAIIIIIIFGFFTMRHRMLKEYYEEKRKKEEKKSTRRTFLSPAEHGKKAVRQKGRLK